MKLVAMITLLSVTLLSFNTTMAYDPIETVPYVNLEEYMGTWYEIARYENRFEKKCQSVKVQYQLKNNYILVLNECLTKNSPNKIIKLEGIAFVNDPQTNAKLKVSFTPIFKYLGLFAGDYWIMELDPDYRYALIGAPDLKYLWIISRTPTLSGNILERLADIAENNGFNRDKIIVNPIWN